MCVDLLTIRSYRFIQKHPGGDEVLQEVGGKDGTKDFDDVGHSSDAVEQMKTYCIGEIVDDEKKKKTPVPEKDDNAVQKKRYCCIGLCSVLAIGVGVFIIYQGFKLFR